MDEWISVLQYLTSMYIYNVYIYIIYRHISCVLYGGFGSPCDREPGGLLMRAITSSTGRIFRLNQERPESSRVGILYRIRRLAVRVGEEAVYHATTERVRKRE